MPFLIIAVIFAGVIFGWRALDNLLVDQNRSTYSEKVSLDIDSGSAKAMIVGKSEWQNAPDKIYLYRGERLKTVTDGRVSLTFFDQSIMRLNTDTEVSFASLKKKNETYNIEVEFNKGNLWSKVERITNPNSTFSITTDLLTIDTRGAVFAISYPGTVYVIEGNAQVGIKYDDDVIKTYTVGVGQQFTVDEDGIADIKKGTDTEVIFALSDTFKRTNWYRWNVKKDGAINAFEESDLDDLDEDDEADLDETDDTDLDDDTSIDADITNIDRVVYVTKPSKKTETSKSTITLEGNYDEEKIEAVYVDGKKASVISDGKWRMTSVKLGLEGENKIKIEAEDLNGNKTAIETFVITYDKTAPDTPVITEPSAEVEGENVTIDDIEQIIKGTVSEDTQAVIVNDYRLGKYVPGSEVFQYYAKTEYGNLEAGENEYKVYAEDKAGNQSEAAIIILELDQEVIDTADGNEDEDDNTTTGATTGATSGATTEESLPTASSSGGVTITAPNEGKSLTTSETEFEITGTVPDGTAKVKVNDYPLSLFEPGDTTFKYRAYVSIGNLKIGEKNSFKVEAFDGDDALVGEASIVIDVESGASAAPVITMPSSTGSYSTTLDTIVIGGTVGKWATRIYINDKEIKDYIPGSEEWRTSVDLSSGENTFVINAEKAGESVGKATIIVNYNQ